MTQAFPSSFVDDKTGRMKKVERPIERFFGEILPNLAQYGILALKTAVAAPLLGGAAVAFGAASLLGVVGRMSGKTRAAGYFDLYTKNADLLSYDLNTARGEADFTKDFGGPHPGFVADYKKAAALLGLNTLPVFHLIKAPPHSEESRKFFAMGQPKTGATAIFAGKLLFEKMTREEARTVIVHEMTHHYRGDPKTIANARGKRSVNKVADIALASLALFGPLPLWPVIGFICATNAAMLLLSSLKSRYREEICDRAANMVTGDGKKIADVIAKMHGGRGGRERMSDITHLLVSSHPRPETRLKRALGFEKKYPDFCAGRRKLFDAFNSAAQPPAANGNQPQQKTRTGKKGPRRKSP